MKFRIEANQRGSSWAARAMDNRKVYYKTFPSEKMAKEWLLEFQIKRLEKTLFKFKKILVKLRGY